MENGTIKLSRRRIKLFKLFFLGHLASIKAQNNPRMSLIFLMRLVGKKKAKAHPTKDHPKKV